MTSLVHFSLPCYIVLSPLRKRPPLRPMLPPIPTCGIGPSSSPAVTKDQAFGYLIAEPLQSANSMRRSILNVRSAPSSRTSVASKMAI